MDRTRIDARFQGLLEAVPDAMAVVGLGGRILLVNAQTLLLFGYTREELYGQPVEMLLPERFRNLHSQHRTGYFAKPRTRLMGTGFELYGLHKDGREFPVEISLSPLETEEGIHVIAAVRDITERKRAAEALRDRDQQLHKVFEEGPLGIALVDLDFRFLRVNARFCEMLGYTDEELQTHTFPEITYPEDIHADVDLAHRLFLGEISRYTMEKRYIRKNGDIIWINLFASLLRDTMDRPTYGLAMVEDITARKQAEADLYTSEERFCTPVRSVTGLWWNRRQMASFSRIRPDDTLMSMQAAVG